MLQSPPPQRYPLHHVLVFQGLVIVMLYILSQHIEVSHEEYLPRIDLERNALR